MPCPPSTAPSPSESRASPAAVARAPEPGILSPVKNPQGNQELNPGTRTRSALLHDLRCRGERGFALLTQRWAILRHVTANPGRITEITRAALLLTQFEHKHLTRNSMRSPH
jgi:hypothetical protein